MKKMIGVLLVLAIVMTGVFAAVPTASDVNVTLNGTVGAYLQHRYSATAMAFDALTPEVVANQAVALEVGKGSQNLGFYSMYTNVPTAVTIKLTAGLFSSNDSGVDTTIGYTLAGVTVSANNTEIIGFLTDDTAAVTAGAATKRRIVSKQLVVALTDDDVTNAIAGAYTAPLVFNVTAN